MSAIRYSGQIRIRITYIDNYGNGLPPGEPKYRCFLRGPDGYSTTIHVDAPASLSHAVDSPEAFDDAARAAIAFADNEGRNGGHALTWGDVAAYDDEGTGYLVARKPDGPRGQRPFFATGV